MSYIDKNLLPDEHILFRTRKNIIIFLYPALWTIFSVAASTYMYHNIMLVNLAWAPWLVAAILWGYDGLEYVTAEFAVTSRRIMMREGFFVRHTNETRLATISRVDVDQSLLGQLLNYGNVSVNTFGAFDAFSMIDRPIIFQRYVNEQLDKIVR